MTVVLYPIYFDRGSSLNKGRRVSLDYAIKEPNIMLLKKALDLLSLNFNVEADKRHPKSPMTSLGRINVHVSEKKSEIISKVATTLKSLEKNSGNSSNDKMKNNKI